MQGCREENTQLKIHLVVINRKLDFHNQRVKITAKWA
jgi:hypothetical protein